MLIQVILPVRLHSQLLPKPIRRLTVEDGLPSNNLSFTFQDSRNYLWIGTINGLCRYNGREFEQFADDPVIKASFAGNFVRAITEDSIGRIYIINQESGLSRYDYHQPEKGFEPILPGKYFPKLKGLSGNAYFLHISNQYLYVCYDDTLRRIDLATRKMELYDPLSRYPEFGPYAFTYFRPILRSGGMVTAFSRARGAVSFDVVTGRIVFRTPEKVNREIAGLTGYTRFNNIVPYLLIIGEYGRFWLFNWVTGAPVADGTIPLPKQTPLLTAGPLDDGTFCYIYDRESLFRYDPLKRRVQDCGFLLEGDKGIVTTYRGFQIMQDGNCYLLTNQGLILWDYQSEGIQNYKVRVKARSSGEISTITSFATVPGAPLLVGTTIGPMEFLDSLNQFSAASLKGRSDLQNTNCYVFTVGDQLYLANRGLYAVDPVRKQATPLLLKGSPGDLHSFMQSKVTCILADPASSRSNLWIGTSKYGLFRCDLAAREIHHVKLVTPDGDTSTHIQALAIDASHRLLVGAKLLGLFVLDPTEEQLLLHVGFDQAKDPHLPPGRLMSIVADPKENTWLIVQSVGLVRMELADQNRPTFTVYGSSYGLSNTILYAGLTDIAGNVWIGSESGIEKWDLQDQRFFHFGPEHGIIENQFREPAWKDRDGYMYFASDHYFVRFHPEELPIDTIPPLVTIRSVQVNAVNRPELNLAKEFQLKANERNIVIRFDVVEFRNPKRAMFRYRVLQKGKDPVPWTYTQQTEVSLPSLAPGDYHIDYNVANENGYWHGRDYRLVIHLPKPWYATFWFYGLCVMAGVGILYGVYRYKIREIEKIVAIRNRISRDLHDDIGSTLGSISIYSEVARQSNLEDRKDVLDKIGDASREMIEKLNDIVWSINPENDTLERMEKRMRAYASLILQPLGISFNLKMVLENPSFKLDMDQRRNIFLIFKEAVHNAAKYSGSGQIDIRLYNSHSQLTMEIRDDGKGFDPRSVPAYNGNGLKSMQERAVAIGGELTIQSQPGSGTRILLVRK